jgi:phospholipid/cholesterol/gamma-HCH transport system ATP-binding protein
MPPPASASAVPSGGGDRPETRMHGDGEASAGGHDEPAPIYGSSDSRADNSPYFSESSKDPVEPLSQQSKDGEEDTLSRHVPLPGSAAAYAGSTSNPEANAQGDQQGGEGGSEPTSQSDPDYEWEQPGRSESQDSSSRVSVVDEPTSRPAPPSGASEEEYRWHTYKVYPSGRPDAVEFIDTYKSFGRNRILRGLNMGLPEGMVSMILGPSGTGKSVCIKHMVGLLYPDEGDVIVHGESVPNLGDDELFEMRKKFGVLFQDGALFGSMNLYDNVAFPLRQHTEKSEDEVADIVNRRLQEVGLGDANEKMPNELSGGMRKRAGFARALVLDPDIVLFDEPDSGLDPVRTALLCELIQEIHEENGGAYVVITHDIMSARRVAEHISVLWKGRIVESGPAEELFNSDNPFVRQFLSGESQGPLGME